MTAADGTVLLAPREVYDLVYACCRVNGLDHGLARRVGMNVVDAEIAGLSGAADFVAAVSAGPIEASPFVRGPALLTEAELELRHEAGRHGDDWIELDPSIPATTVMATVAEMTERGVNCEGVTPVGAEDRARAAREGLAVDAAVLAALEADAGRFLVAEAEVDAAVTPTD